MQTFSDGSVYHYNDVSGQRQLVKERWPTKYVLIELESFLLKVQLKVYSKYASKQTQLSVLLLSTPPCIQIRQQTVLD